MSKYSNDKRIVMTLDAGGTNFVFSAIQGNKEIIEPIHLPSNGSNLDLCLETIIKGFREVEYSLKEKPVAISFAFPGPADYPNGIIYDLHNLPGFRGGVALGPLLQNRFKLPVFINNDGDLYAYGEAIAGILPEINTMLAKGKSPKRFKNLVGFTLGTGFGGGIVRDGELYIGDNSAATEVWIMSSPYLKNVNVEEGVSIRAVERVYAELTNIPKDQAPTPKEIYEIGIGKQKGNIEAAKEAYHRMGQVLGDVMANILTITDGIAVIGGGVAGAKELFWDSMLEEMNRKFENFNGEHYKRIVQKVYDLEDKKSNEDFMYGKINEIVVPYTDERILYDSESRVGVGLTRIGTSRAISIGAYAYALHQLDK